jgi:hypothetical protein
MMTRSLKIVAVTIKMVENGCYRSKTMRHSPRCYKCHGTSFCQSYNAKGKSFFLCNGCSNIFEFDPVLLRQNNRGDVHAQVGRVLAPVLAGLGEVHTAKTKEEVSREEKPKSKKEKREVEQTIEVTLPEYWR